MPITRIEDDFIEQSCLGCGQTRKLELGDLTVGAGPEDAPDPRIVALPPCDQCGSAEFLIRSTNKDTAEKPRSGGYGHLHRLLVDELHGRLVANGRLTEGLKPDMLEGLGAVDERELRRWFPDGLTLPARTNIRIDHPRPSNSE
jgi:hypothetical protein